MDINQMVLLVASLAGFGSLVAFLVQVGKYFGIVKDGDAPKFVAGFNLLGMALVFAAYLFYPELDIIAVDGQLAQAVTVMSTVFGYVIMIFGSKFTYAQLKGLPLIGLSFSEKE